MMRLLCAVSTLALAACGGSLFQSKAPPASVYLLSAGAAAPSGAELPADLAVLQPRVRTGLDTDLIAVLYPDRRLDYFAGARWSGPLDRGGARPRVAGISHRRQTAQRPCGILRLRQRLLARNRRCGLSGRIFRRHGRRRQRCADGPCAPARAASALRRPAHPGTFEADDRQRAADNRLTAIVEAYNRAADAALAQIVADTTRTLSEGLETGSPQ